ncbi:MAG: hypothetical protein ACETV1_02820, partial [Candidatus Bathyarchaeia archaeon]
KREGHENTLGAYGLIFLGSLFECSPPNNRNTSLFQVDEEGKARIAGIGNSRMFAFVFMPPIHRDRR